MSATKEQSADRQTLEHRYSVPSMGHVDAQLPAGETRKQAASARLPITPSMFVRMATGKAGCLAASRIGFANLKDGASE